MDGTYKGPVSEVRPKKRNTRSTTTFLRGGLLYYVISKIPVEFLRLNQSSDHIRGHPILCQQRRLNCFSLYNQKSKFFLP